MTKKKDCYTLGKNKANSIISWNLSNLSQLTVSLHHQRLQTDLQEIFGMIQCKESKEKLIKYLREKESYFRNVDEETYQAIREFLHSERILKGQIKKEEGKETVDMCKALEDLYNDGIEQGIVRGMIETLKDLGMEKNHAIVRVMEKFGITQEEAENDVEKYWV